MRLSLRSLSLATVAAAALAVAPAAYADTNFTIGGTAPTGGFFQSVVSGVVPTTNYNVGYTAAAYITVAGTVDFYYHIDSMMTLPANPSDALNRLSMSVFGITDLLSVQAVGPGNAPDGTAILHTNGVLDVNFTTNPITNGMTSETIWLITNATSYTFGTFAAADGFVAQLQGYDPIASSSTPEPSTFALMGTGLLAAAGAVRRRLKA